MFKKRRRRTKVQQIREKRTRGKYRKMGIAFIICGFLLLVVSVVMYYLYNQGVIYKDSWYSAPVPINGIGKIFVLQNPTVGVEKSLQKAGISYKSVVLAQDTYTIKLSTGETVYFSANKSINLQTSSLQAVLHSLTIESKPVKSVDFRYDKPVVSFK